MSFLVEVQGRFLCFFVSFQPIAHVVNTASLGAPWWPSSILQVEQYLVGSVLDRLADELHNHRAVARALAVEGPRLVLHLCTTAHAARVRAESIR